MLSGLNIGCINYDQLSVLQSVTSFCHTIKEEKDLDIRDNMLDNMIVLLEDAQDFPWSTTKANHAVLLCRTEQDDIKDFTQVDKIESIRRANAQRHIPQSQNKNTETSVIKLQKLTKTVLCQFYVCSFAKI